jgi:thiamine kinase-like enzyme
MKISIEIPVIVYKNEWYQTEGKIEIEWYSETYSPQEGETASLSVIEGLKTVRKQIEEALEMVRSEGKLLPDLQTLIRIIERKKRELEEIEQKIKNRNKKVKTLEKALRQFGIEPENFGVFMDLERIKIEPALEVNSTTINEEDEIPKF